MIARLLSGATHTVLARLSALTLSLLFMFSLGTYAVLHFGLLESGSDYKAEFADAWPLVAGMDVRVSGAVAGSVRGVSLTNRGTAEVTFQLEPGVPRPRADASVAIRQSDLLGDTDLSLSLGRSPRPLESPIPMSRSLQAPRLDDFLNIFQQPVRTALKAFIVEFGTALENRGVDINAAILQLRPGFQALGQVLDELHSQIGALREVIDSSHAVTSQLAQRTDAIGRLIGGLQRTSVGVAAQSNQLDAGLARLPGTLNETDTTLRHVQSLTAALEPLARTFVAGAPGFARAASLIGPYSRALSAAADFAAPTIALSAEALRHGGPAFSGLRKIGFANLFNPTGSLFAALNPLLGELADGIFGTKRGGGLGGVVLPGNDALAPNVDPARDYLSAYLVISCEMFGVRQGPGCLNRFLSTYSSPGSASADLHRTRSVRPRMSGSADAPARSVAPASTAAPAPAKPPPAPNQTPSPPPPQTDLLKPLLDYLIKP